jgi:hypothetical protein
MMSGSSTGSFWNSQLIGELKASVPFLRCYSVQRSIS